MEDQELFSFSKQEFQDAEAITAPRYSYWQYVRRGFFQKRSNWICLGILAIVLLFAFGYPLLIGYDAQVDPYRNLLDAGAKHLSPKAAMEKFGYNIHWVLGAGASGQSTFDAVWYGAGISLALALICAGINLTVGIIVGLLWGFSRKLDAVMTEVYNIVSNVPYILLVSVIVLILSAGFWSMVFALTVTGWLPVAYYIRNQVLIIRNREYNIASQCLGTPTLRLIRRNILPFMTSNIVTLAASEIPSYISYEVFLSYIGLGLSQMSLGKLIQGAQSAMVTPGWGFEFWSPVAVASVIAVVLYILGQNLADASDPKTHI